MTDEELNKIGQLMDLRLIASEQRVTSEVGKFMEDHLFQALEEKADKSDIERLERKLDNFIGQVAEHSQDLQKIKAIPVIAHELRAKKD